MSDAVETMAYTPSDLAQTLGERLTKGMKLAAVSRSDMAEYLGVGQSTVTTWTSDRITPSVQTLRLWALRTGVPFEWLKTGKIPHPDGPDEGLTMLPHLDSNQKPAGLQSRGSDLRVRKMVRHLSVLPAPTWQPSGVPMSVMCVTCGVAA